MNIIHVFQRSFFVVTLFCAFQLYSAATSVSISNLREACAIFGLTKDSAIDQQSLKKIYRKKAKKFHPDRYQGSKDEAEALFKGLGKACEILLNNIGRIPKVWDEPTSDVRYEGFYYDIQVGQKIKDVNKVCSFSSGFVKNTIHWINAELFHSYEGRVWATQNITPAMRLCVNWLKVMAFVRTNNWQELSKLVQANPRLVHLHDGQADALSVAFSAYKEAPDRMKEGMLKAQCILKEHGAVARFPDYDGGIIGFGEQYWY